MCDRLAIINHGRLLASGSPRQLINRIEASYAVRLVAASPLTEEQVESLAQCAEAVPGPEPIVDGNTCLLRLHNDPAALQDLLDEVGRCGVALEQLEITPVTLEDVFIELTRN